MVLFEDVFTGDKLMSDAHAFTLEYNGAMMKVKSKLMLKDTTQGLSGEEESEEMLYRLFDVEHQYNLVKDTFSRKDYEGYSKEFASRLKKYLEANVSASRAGLFQQGATDFVKFVLSKFSEFEFFWGASMDPDSAIVHAYWEDENDEAPTFYFFKDALREVKS